MNVSGVLAALNTSKYKKAIAIAAASLVTAGAVTTGLAVTNTGVFSNCGPTPHSVAAIGLQLACPAPSLALTVSGNQLTFAATGARFTPQGVNRSGPEYMCIGGNGGLIFDGPSDDASIAAMQKWRINIVRVPLNEDCWLGINGADTVDGITAAQYQTAIQNYVTLLNRRGMTVILDLQWTAPGANLANAQTSMADNDHSPAFWTSVAATFKSNLSVLFDLFNEPVNVSWACWLNGCLETTQYGAQNYGNYQTAGMQQMLNAVRATGANNVVMASGITFANDMSQWLANAPVDPAHELVASHHSYQGQTCSSLSCWQSQVQPILASFPVITGEIGELDQTATYINSYMAWADSVGIGYLAWTWDAYGLGGCSGGSVILISDYTGTPCQSFGVGYQAWLATGQPAPPPSTTTTSTSTIPATTTTTTGGGGSTNWLSVAPPTVTTNFNVPCGQCNYGFDSIAVDPTNGAVFVGTDYSGLWKSSNQGGTWTKMDTGTNSGLLDEGRVWNLAIDPFNHNNIYVSSGYGAGGPLKSTDGGVDWTLLPSPNPTTNDTHSIYLDPYLQNHLIVAYHYYWNGNQDSGVSESFDGGQTWTQHAPPAGAGAGNAAWILNNSSTWLFNTQNGVWRSTNSGASWTQVITSTGAHGSSNALSGNFSTGNLVIANGTQILQSTDGGVTWSLFGDSSTGLGFQFYQSVVSDGTNYYTSGAFPNPSYNDGTIYFKPVAGGNWAPYGSTKTCYTDASNNGPNCNGMNFGVYDSVNHVAYSVNLLGGVWKHAG